MQATASSSSILSFYSQDCVTASTWRMLCCDSCFPFWQEQEAFSKAASLDTHKALVHIFFAQRSTKKVKGVTDAGLKARKVRKVAVIGGGLMGSGIATAGLLAGQEVIIKEVNDKFLQVRCHALFSSPACPLLLLHVGSSADRHCTRLCQWRSSCNCN